jgi:hypothetical protein
MSRIFHRPMFRIGGSAGEGITSGLRQEYKRGRVVEPGGYDGEERGAINIDFTKGFEHAKKRRDEILGKYPTGTSDADFWLNWGTNILAQPGGRPILQTLGTAAKEPLARMQEQKTMERLGQREEDKDFLNTWIAGRAAVLGGESGSDFMHESKIDIGLEAIINRQKHNQSWNPEWEKLDPQAEDYEKQKAARQKWIDDRESIQHILDQVSTQIGVDVDKIVAAEGGIDNIKRSNKIKLLESEEIMTHPETGVQIEVGEYYEDNPQLVEIEIDKMTIDDIKALILGAQGWDYTGKKEGGRAGYQGGELVEQEDVNIQTPRGDISMQETVEEGAMPDQLSFQELRSRLPAEVTDDIIRLITNSSEALTDFAKIQTQQDVDNFNAKYGVNLVLPSEA